jgi:hypothetical protein
MLRPAQMSYSGCSGKLLRAQGTQVARVSCSGCSGELTEPRVISAWARAASSLTESEVRERENSSTIPSHCPENCSLPLHQPWRYVLTTCFEIRSFPTRFAFDLPCPTCNITCSYVWLHRHLQIRSSLIWDTTKRQPLSSFLFIPSPGSTHARLKLMHTYFVSISNKSLMPFLFLAHGTQAILCL